MSEHCGYIVKIDTLNKIENADRLQEAVIFGSSVVVDLRVKVGDVGVFFPSDLQLSEEFCDYNHLCRKTATGEPDSGYLEREKRNVRPIRLRGVRSDGLYLPLESLAYTGVKLPLEVGTTISVLNGHEICRKYIPRCSTNVGKTTNVRKHGKKKQPTAPIAPLFKEHADTEQLAYNLDKFREGDLIEITLKMHGTSQRTAYTKVLKGFKRSFIDKIFHREGKPIYDWGYVSGTRRTVLKDFDGGFYGSNQFREPHSRFFEGKLHKGETAYYEVVGFQTNGNPIMGTVNNKKTKDKEFIRTYGEQTTFSYGCDPTGKVKQYGKDEVSAYSIETEVPQSDFYVYRMTMTTEDGDVVEYTPDFMRYRCEQMGCKTVPVFWKGYIPETCNSDFVLEKAEEFYDGPDPIGKTHIREGVVVRIVNRPKFEAYKHKNWFFKTIEGILKDEAGAPDMEEAEELK